MFAMDLYGSWDTVSSSNNNSGTSTPVASTSNAAGANSSSPRAEDGSRAKKAASSPTLEQELEQMGNFVSGIMGKSSLGSVWGSFRRQVSEWHVQ